jgi:hypothetical protein
MMRAVLAVSGLAGLAILAIVVATRDPVDPLSIGAAIAGASLAVASFATLGGLVLEDRAARDTRRRPREPRRAPALRRGLGLGALVAAFALLRAVDGLTLITGGFVLAGFVLAEIVLTARPATSST